tara:strand:- start:6958 stop:7758 length:801 start_codon:yes stop_codon:yes gene_type:complete
MDPMTAMQIYGGVSSIFGGKRQKKDAARAARQALEQRQEQQKKVDEQVAEYKAMKFTNPYANLENTAEDLRVSTEAATFQKQQMDQSRADILGQLRGAAGGSGIAGLAQSLANQGALQAQKISAGLARQELGNEQARAKAAADIQFKRAQGDIMVQQAETSRQSTILGMQMGQSQAANKAYQQALLNQRKANIYGSQMMMSGVKNLASIDFSQFGGGDTPLDPAQDDVVYGPFNENEMADQMTLTPGGDADGDGVSDFIDNTPYGG